MELSVRYGRPVSGHALLMLGRRLNMKIDPNLKDDLMTEILMVDADEILTKEKPCNRHACNLYYRIRNKLLSTPIALDQFIDFKHSK